MPRRRLALLLVLGALACPVVAGAQQAPLQTRLDRALRVPHVAPARSAAVAMDLATGTVLFTQNPSLPLAPASNEKLPLTYAALSNLGTSYRLETDVLGEGSQDATTFDGALVLLLDATFPSDKRPANIRQMLGRPGEAWGGESGQDRLVVVRD